MRRYPDSTVILQGSRLRYVFFYIILNVAFIMFFAGIMATLHAKHNVLSSDIKEVTANISTSTLQEVISNNIPYIKETLQKPSEDKKSWSALAFELVTQVNLHDPRTFLKELPMFALFDTEITAASEGIDFTSIPIESPPPPEIEKQILSGLDDENNSNSGKSSLNKKQVFVYHTHFWESYLPELKEKNPRKANSLTNNIMKVGKHFTNTLEENGIGAILSKKPKTGWNKAYQHSKKIVVSAMKNNSDLNYFIDLHRDSSRRNKTTITLNGKSYAQLAFVVGKESKYYQENKKISEYLCTEINKKQKGVCKAVFTKQQTKLTNGEYNQSLSPQSMLVEVGGVDNTFQEANRSIEVLAQVLIEKIGDSLPKLR